MDGSQVRVLYRYFVSISSVVEQSKTKPKFLVLPVWRNWIAHLTSNQEVMGSSPITGTLGVAQWQSSGP